MSRKLRIICCAIVFGALTAHSTAQPLIEIPDRNLRDAIASELGISADQITVADMLRLTSLEVSRTTLSNLSGIESAINLIHLNIWGNEISDISQLSGLVNLARLNIGGNAITDLTPLYELTSLNELWMGRNSVSDISPLVGNTGIGIGDFVDVRNNPLSEVSLHIHVPELKRRQVDIRYHASQIPAQLRYTGAEADVGERFVISLVADSITNLASWQHYTFNYSREALKVISIDEGDLLRQSGVNTYFLKGHMHDSLGLISGISGALVHGSVSGTGTLMTITFEARQAQRNPQFGGSLGFYQRDGAEILWDFARDPIIITNYSGDVNADGVVDIRDLVSVATSFNRFRSYADLNGDFKINLLDLIIVAENLD